MANRCQLLTATLLAALSLSACVTMPRVYSEQELSAVAKRCGVAEGEVVQEPDYPQILFLYSVAPSPSQRACVERWSRRRNLHFAFIDSVVFE